MDGETESVRKPKARLAELVAERVAGFEDSPPVAEGVQPLNPGFFKVQRMRMAAVPGEERS